jgi:hypothetical protein
MIWRLKVGFSLVLFLGCISLASFSSAAASSSAAAPSGTSACANRALTNLSSTATPSERQAQILADFQSRGWTPTAAGKSILAGAKLPGQAGANAPFSAATGQVIIATGPEKKFVRRPAGAQRLAGSQYVFLNCFWGVTAHISYTMGIGSGRVAWHKFRLGGSGFTTYGPWGYCGSQNGCLVYAWSTPAPDVEIFDATVTTTGVGPNIVASYCAD